MISYSQEWYNLTVPTQIQRMQQQMEQMMQQMGRGARGPVADAPMPDTAEKIQISSLSLLKMLKHGE